MSTTPIDEWDYPEENAKLCQLCGRDGGDLAEIEELLSSRQGIGTPYYEGETPLHVAVTSGREDDGELVELLINNGVDINAATYEEGNTGLHLVVERGRFPQDLKLVYVLMTGGADLSIRNRKLRTPYDCAVARGNFALAAALDGTLDADQAIEVYRQKVATTFGPAVVRAVLESDMKALKLNLEAGGDPDTLNRHGAGAIHYAITHWRLDPASVLHLLRQHGADVNLTDEEGDTALNLVIKSEKVRESGKMLDLVVFLMDWGADPSLQDIDGNDAHTLAEERGYTDVAAVLSSMPVRTPPPADVEPEPEEEVEAEEEEDVKTPRSVGIASPAPAPAPEDPDGKPDKDGLYPIHLALLAEPEEERQRKIEEMLAKGADINKKAEKTGNTLLHLCAERNLKETAEFLLSKNADKTITNAKDQVPCDSAEENGHEELVPLLQVEKPDDKKKKSGGCTIL